MVTGVESLHAAACSKKPLSGLLRKQRFSEESRRKTA